MHKNASGLTLIAIGLLLAGATTLQSVSAQNKTKAASTTTDNKTTANALPKSVKDACARKMKIKVEAVSAALSKILAPVSTPDDMKIVLARFRSIIAERVPLDALVERVETNLTPADKSRMTPESVQKIDALVDSLAADEFKTSVQQVSHEYQSKASTGAWPFKTSP